MRGMGASQWQGQGSSELALATRSSFFYKKFKLIYNDGKQTSILLGRGQGRGGERRRGIEGGRGTFGVIITFSFTMETGSQVSVKLAQLRALNTCSLLHANDAV